MSGASLNSGVSSQKGLLQYDPDLKLQKHVLWWVHDLGDKFEAKIRSKQEAVLHRTVSLGDVVSKHGVPCEELIKTVVAKAEMYEACRTLPFTILLVVSFALVVYTHDNALVVNAVEDSIAFDIIENANFAFSSPHPFMGHKNMEDVNSHADFWSWMTRGFVPLVFKQRYELAEGRNWSEPYVQDTAEVFPIEDRGVYLNYNRIVLGVRLSQERAAEKVSCPESKLQSFYDKECVGGLMWALEPEVIFARRNNDATRVQWLLIQDDVDTIQRQLLQMEKDLWLDERTTKVQVAIPVYNGEYGLHTLVQCNFFFSRGGHIWKAIIPQSAFADTFKKWESYLYDITWLACLLWMFGNEVYEIVSMARAYGCSQLCQQYLQIWNIIDWFSILSGVVIVILFSVHESNTHSMNAALEEFGNLKANATGPHEYFAKGAAYAEALATDVHFFFYLKLVLAFYPLVIVLRLFKAFGSHPRLAVVTSTLKAARIDLAHFGIIFCSVFLTYMVAGIVLFGKASKSFATAARAANTCFRMMFGDFEWDEMQIAGRLDSFVWFVPFEVLVTLLMINMIMAIVMDAYSEVANSTDSDSLWLVAKRVISGLARPGHHVDPNKMVARLKAEKLVFISKEAPADSLASVAADIFRRDGSRHSDDEMAADTAGQRGSIRSDYEMGDEINGRGYASEVFRTSVRSQSSHGGGELLVTVSMLKRFFPSMSIPDCEAAIADAINSYYTKFKDAADVDSTMRVIHALDSNIEMTKESFEYHSHAIAQSGLAQNNSEEVGEVGGACYAEISAAQEDLSEWLPEDLDDLVLPENLLRSREEQPVRAAVTSGNALLALERVRVSGGEEKSSLLTCVRQWAGSSSGGSNKERGPDIVEGGAVMVLNDEPMVLSACRAAGIGTVFDHLRRQALGRLVEVLERDERDGTVRCRVPDVGDVWFAVGAFAPKLKDELGGEGSSTTISDRSTSCEVLERRIQNLEQELRVGRETTQEAVQAVSELQGRFQSVREEKKRGIERFQLLRQRAVSLNKDNREQCERLRASQLELKTLAHERDKLMERVRALADDNHELESQLELRFGVSDNVAI